jgi:hypothetical protein
VPVENLQLRRANGILVSGLCAWGTLSRRPIDRRFAVLGDKIAQESGQVIGTRVLPSDAGPKLETTFQAHGAILGVDGTDTGTYWTVLRADGTFYGEGSGVLMTPEGVATWKGAGVGHPSGEGMGASFRGAVYFETNAPALDRMNHCAAVYEFAIDPDGKCHNEVWEWS